MDKQQWDNYGRDVFKGQMVSLFIVLTLPIWLPFDIILTVFLWLHDEVYTPAKFISIDVRQWIRKRGG